MYGLRSLGPSFLFAPPLSVEGFVKKIQLGCLGLVGVSCDLGVAVGLGLQGVPILE